MNFLEILNQKFETNPKERTILNLLQIKHDRAIDILLNLPFRYNPKKIIKNINEFFENEHVILKIKVIKILNEERFLKIKVDFDGFDDVLELIFFKFNIGYIKSVFQINREVFISGKLSTANKKNFFTNYNKKTFQIIHPEILRDFNEDLFNDLGDGRFYSIPIYHSVKNISNEVIRSFIFNAFRKIELKIKESQWSEKIFPEWMPQKLLVKYNWKNFFESLKIIHQFGENYQVFDKNLILRAKQRIMFDEFFIKHLLNKVLKNNLTKEIGRAVKGDFSLRNKILDSIGFDLTNDQKRVLEDEIYKDQALDSKMNRILQGDVGSGKTIVAMLSMLNSSECGFQSILMCPTEILARQHYEYFVKVFENAGILFDEKNESIPSGNSSVEVIFLSSKTKKKKKILEEISNASNVPQIIIGTHAVFQEKVKFREIGLIVIDEQHRFGVKARQDLSEKDQKADVLLMSATPIPRTLAMSEFGYLDHSILKEKPAHRKKISTSVLNISLIDEIFLKIKDFIQRSEKIYWICPLIEESLKLDLVAIEKRIETLNNVFGFEKIGVIHGKMKEDQINDIMNQFKNGEKNILLATTVVEVGVNITDATLIVIEDAQRFGLSQLHQLRGRVGRSDLQSYCILFYKSNQISKQSLFRLKNLAKTEDGFEISELDLKIRGPGEFCGIKQSGFDSYISGNPVENEKIFQKSYEFSEIIFNFFEFDIERIFKKFEILMNIFNVFQRKI